MTNKIVLDSYSLTTLVNTILTRVGTMNQALNKNPKSLTLLNN